MARNPYHFRRKGLPPAIALWQNRDNFFLSRERLNRAGRNCASVGGGELTRLTGLKLIRKGDRMKKSLIALAVAGAFAAPAAMADVTISGAINVGIAYINSGSAPVAGPGSESVTRTSVATNYSNINISSSDDIGNGNKIIFNYQMQTNVSGFNTPQNRNSYLGLTGSWGTFKAGQNENVYERFMYESDPLDGAVGMGGNIQMLGHSGRS